MSSGSRFDGSPELITALIFCFVFYQEKMKKKRLIIQYKVLNG